MAVPVDPQPTFPPGVYVTGLTGSASATSAAPEPPGEIFSEIARLQNLTDRLLQTVGDLETRLGVALRPVSETTTATEPARVECASALGRSLSDHGDKVSSALEALDAITKRIVL